MVNNFTNLTKIQFNLYKRSWINSSRLGFTVDENNLPIPWYTFDAIEFLKENGYVENSNYLGTWEIKKDDGSFGATLVLNPDKKTINKSTILGPQDIISSIQETFNKFSVPVIVTDGKLLSRAPFDNKDIIKAIADVVKTEEF